MSLAALIKRLENIMRSDTGIDGTAQRLAQIVWLMFLKVFDYKEMDGELEEDYEPVIPVGYRWRDWATCLDEETLEIDVRNQKTGAELISFVNNELLPVLRGEAIKVDGKDVVLFTSESPRALLVKDFMRRTINYSQNGIQLRLMINLFDEVNFDSSEDVHEFNDMYEDMLKSLQGAGKAGEFYTPRAITQFAVKHVDPRLGESVADFACGTCGFLVDAKRHLEKQVQRIEDWEVLQTSLHGNEWKPLPYMLGVTNLMLHDIQLPDIEYGDALARKRLNEYGREDRVDCIVMNPPYGGVATAADKQAFPGDLRSSETFDLFMGLILKRLADKGRAVVVLPDGFMFGDGVKATIKEKLMRECNLHTVIRLPQSVFAPYTSITTNLLFFDKTGSTSETWFYRFDMPEGYKHFSKTKPMLPKHMEVIDEWWDNRVEMVDDEGYDKAKCYSFDEIKESGFNLNLCGYPAKTVEVLSPEDTMKEYREKKAHLDAEIDAVLDELSAMLGIELGGE